MHVGFTVEEESLLVQEIEKQSLGPRNRVWAKEESSIEDRDARQQKIGARNS